MNEEKQNYFDANNFIADFISEYCVIKETANCKLKELLHSLTSHYQKETSKLSTNALTDMLKKELAKYDSVVYKKVGTYKFFGIGLLDEHQRNFDFEDIKSSAEEINMQELRSTTSTSSSDYSIDADEVDLPF